MPAEHSWVDTAAKWVAVVSVVAFGLLIGFVAMGGVR